MTTKKSLFVFFAILVISVWVLGSAILAGAETLNYKSYTWVIKGEIVPIGDVEGHRVNLIRRGLFFVFDNGEVATGDSVSIADIAKGSGPYNGYSTIKFEDGSTIITKSQGTTGMTAAGAPGSSGGDSEIIKGTGRFEGIKGTLNSKTKYLPLGKEEVAPRGYGEGTITYTLPRK